MMGNADFKQGKRKKIQEENFVSCEEKIQSVFEVTNQGEISIKCECCFPLQVRRKASEIYFDAQNKSHQL